MISTRFRTLALTCILPALFAACSGGGIYRDLADPIALDDYEAVPAQVTRENARLVVRRCLQAHRRSSATPESECGYAFREAGFVQLCHFRPLDREQERASRTYIDYRALSDAKAEPRYNFNRLKEEFRVTLRGTFRKWESHVRAFRVQPDLDSEEDAVAVGCLVLSFDDPAAANRLVQAVNVLASR